MTRTRLALLPAALLLGLTACAGGSGSDAAVSTESAEVAQDQDVGGSVAGGGVSGSRAQGRQFSAADQDGAALDALSYDATSGEVPAEEAAPDSAAQEPAIISTGTVSLRADDVAEARFEVQKVVDRVDGEITDSETRTDEDGSVRDARLVLRVPSSEFTEAMDALEKVADLEASSTNSEDVTTQVVDTAVRIRVQRESIARIEQLLARAGSIRAVVAVERELTSREARLNSLLGQQAYLADQTSMSTIKVHLQPKPEEDGPPREDDDEQGFVAGLEAGWDALSTVAVNLATATGALLPFAVVALVLGVPGWVLLRGAAKRRRTTVPEAQPSS